MVYQLALVFQRTNGMLCITSVGLFFVYIGRNGAYLSLYKYRNISILQRNFFVGVFAFFLIELSILSVVFSLLLSYGQGGSNIILKLRVRALPFISRKREIYWFRKGLYQRSQHHGEVLKASTTPPVQTHQSAHHTASTPWLTKAPVSR